jgi:hypothetical protein
MDPTEENKRLRARSPAMGKGLDALRVEHKGIKEENRAAKFTIEYLKTHNPSKA